MHILPIVPGHKHVRIAIRSTETTVNELKVSVTCYMSYGSTLLYTGSKALSRILSKVIIAMDNNEFCPFKPLVEVCNHSGINPYNCPLSLGCRHSVDNLSSTSIEVRASDGIYHVPNGCDTKNYRRPCGLGSTLVANNVVLMYPNVLQCLVSSEMRQCDTTDTGFLCCSSSPSSASSKGMIRYLVPGVVIRSYMMGVRDQMMLLSSEMDSLSCQCSSTYIIIKLFGNAIGLCESCYVRLMNNYNVYSRRTPHYITLHYDPDNSNRATMSVCTGTIMRLVDRVDGAVVGG